MPNESDIFPLFFFIHSLGAGGGSRRTAPLLAALDDARGSVRGLSSHDDQDLFRIVVFRMAIAGFRLRIVR